MFTTQPEVAAAVRRADLAISVRGLVKSHARRPAVRGIDLDVRRGEVLALLGPNGAGKTTTVSMLEGLTRPDAGRVLVLGEDPAGAGAAWRDRIGVVLQDAAPEPDLTVGECLELHAGFYSRPRSVGEALELAGLTGFAARRAARLSGGERRRLDVALALIGDPELLFLDEPTTGFDPAARRAAWETIGNLRDLGLTVVLTTHYLEEAEVLADRIVVLRDGAIVAQGTPATLGARDTAAAHIAYTAADGERVVLESTAVAADLHRLTGEALARGEDLHDLSVTRPTLEDVYLELTTEEGA